MLTELLFLGPTLLLCGLYLARVRKAERTGVAVREAAVEARLVEPPSLHPVIDSDRCVGCGSCIRACPETDVFGRIGGRVDLVNPSHCIGHGACQAACGQEAIALVFGTATRGVDIPAVRPNFETNVPGLFIAGELGGMGLIRNAIEQGRQAIDSILTLEGIGKGEDLDVVIVGAGPAGFSASLAAMEHGLRHVTVEQDSLGGTVSHYPRGKLVMTAPARLPMVGRVRFAETTKEELLTFWQDVERRTGVEIRYRERVERIERTENGFTVATTADRYRTRSVLLAIGRRGTPRKLGVPGEEHPKVTYRLTDPEQYRGQHVLVVGGGDSALEAAARIAEQPGTTVSLSYRSDAFGRAKEKNRTRVGEAEAEGRLAIYLRSNVERIAPDRVVIQQGDRRHELPNDAIVVCAGGILPTAFLESVGIEVETKFGTV